MDLPAKILVGGIAIIGTMPFILSGADLMTFTKFFSGFSILGAMYFYGKSLQRN